MRRPYFATTVRPQPALAMAASTRTFYHQSAIGAPTIRLLVPVSPPSADPIHSRTRAAILTQTEASALATHWSLPAPTNTSRPKAPPTGVELVACVAAVQLAQQVTPASPASADQAPMKALLPRLTSSVLRARDSPHVAVEGWCGDVAKGHVSGEGLLYALQLLERALAYSYDMNELPALGITAVDAKQLALTILAARVQLEGLLLEELAAKRVSAHQSEGPTSHTTSTATKAKQEIDEFSTSVPRVLNTVEHLYWSVASPVREGTHPVPPPPLHESGLVSDVALPSDRQQWWFMFTRTLTTPVLRSVLLSSLRERAAGASPSSASNAKSPEDEQAVEALQFTLRVLYGLYGRYEALSLGQRVNYGAHVVFPYLCRDASFLLSACLKKGGREATSAVAPTHTATKSQSARAATKKSSAASQASSTSSSASARQNQNPSAIGAEKHTQMTLIVLVVLLALGYAASLVPSSGEKRTSGTKAKGTDIEKMEKDMVRAGHQTANYQKLLSDIKAK